MGTWNSAALSIYMGNQPRLSSDDLLLQSTQERQFINSQSNGTVVIEVESILRNFNKLGIST